MTEFEGTKVLMTPHEAQVFSQVLCQGGIFGEYGIGGSTEIASQNAKVTKIISVESDNEFLTNALRKPVLEQALKENRLLPIWVNIGEVGYWGYPKDDAKLHLWPNYPLSLFQHEKPNLCLIDGRFRVACALVCALEMEKDDLIMIHDYPTRPHYRVVENFLEPVRTVETLALFRVRKHLSRVKALRSLKTYMYSPNDRHVPIWKKAFIHPGKRLLGLMK